MYFTKICTIILLIVFTISCKSADCDNNKTNTNNKKMKLKGDSERIDDKFVKFKLSATRLEIVDNEYLPNSESLRVEIYDSNNSIIFNSSLGQNFFMAIMDVEPKEIGETKTFEYLWDYKDNFKKKVKPGKYSVRLIIPAMPDQYFTTIEFEILN